MQSYTSNSCEPLSQKKNESYSNTQNKAIGLTNQITNHNSNVQSRATTSTTKTVASVPLKTNAKGDARIPENKRIYLEVVYPMNTSIQPKIMFFNQEWSVGKALDVIADAGGVINPNNKPGPEKLCLFSLKTGEILPTSVPLSGLSPQVCSFDTILLERVESKKMIAV